MCYHFALVKLDGDVIAHIGGASLEDLSNLVDDLFLRIVLVDDNLRGVFLGVDLDNLSVLAVKKTISSLTMDALMASCMSRRALKCRTRRLIVS